MLAGMSHDDERGAAMSSSSTAPATQTARMPRTTNLTRAEAQERSALLRVDSYAVDLDLSGAADPSVAVFGSRTVVDMTARAAGSTFIDLIAPAVRSVKIGRAHV